MIVTVEPDAIAPRVKVETTGTSVYRLQGAVRTRVRGFVTDGAIYDYECPQETPVAYDDELTVSDLVELPDLGMWLVHPASPELSRRVVLSRHDGWVTPSFSSEAVIPGGETVSVFFRRPSDLGSLSVKLWSREDVEDFKALMASGSTLFLSTPYELGLGPGYVSVGDISWERVGQRSESQYRFASFPFRFVRRPEVVTAQSFSIDDLTGTIDSLAGTINDLGS